MAVRKVITLPNGVLHQKSSPVEKFDRDLRRLVRDMFDTMYDDDGIGLACVQIGILKRIVVIDLQDDNPEHKVVLINPKITFFSNEKSVLEEGCLSVPEKRYGILRPVEVEVAFVDEFGKPHKIKADGLFAKCIQHECDHLDGITIVDRSKEQGDIEKQEK